MKPKAIYYSSNSLSETQIKLNLRVNCRLQNIEVLAHLQCNVKQNHMQIML